jgi:predicted DNA-binding transcriptional regulator YafY
VAKLDRLERLTDLVLVLLNASRPLTLDAIAREVPGYPEDKGARRQAFERDKRLLRDEGIAVAAEPVEGLEQFGYRIDPEAFYLPDLHLEPDERAALHLAVAGVELSDPSGRNALLKLGATGLSETRPFTSFESSPTLVALFEALRARAEIRFSYRGEARHMVPARLWFRRGRWYLVGWDLVREGARTFRVDRIDDVPEVGDPGSGELPEDFDASSAALEDPWRGGEQSVQVAIDAIEAARVSEEVGEQCVTERHEDGSIVLELKAADTESLRPWVLGLLDHAEILGPPEVRADIVGWLDQVAATVVVDSPEGSQRVPLTPADLSAPPVAPDPGEEGSSRDASQRLRRLLAIVGWLAQVEEASLADISARFSIPEDEVVRELELAACCGLPPYSPDVLMEIVVTDQTVRAFLPAELARPRRLSAAEGFALAATGRTILAVPGADEQGALARALVKLDAALGSHHSLVVDLDDPSLLDEVRSATDAQQQIEIEYHSASSDETTQRIVEPVVVVSLDGHWYLDAYCHRAEGLRRFRIDRIRSMKVLGPRTIDVDDLEVTRVPSQSFVPGPGNQTIRLELSPRASWVADTLPVIDVAKEPGGKVEVTMAVGGRAWLERLLLQLGPDARVLEPSELALVGPEAARRVLARYRPSS